jgi:hypothetical protein
LIIRNAKLTARLGSGAAAAGYRLLVTATQNGCTFSAAIVVFLT